MDSPRCTATTRAGAPCANAAIPGKAVCLAHDRDAQAERGRKGGFTKAAKERAQRADQAQALVLATAADLRATLTAATREAFADGDWAVVISAVRTGIELLKTADLEQQVAELRQVIEAIRGPRSAA
jgi:hypothetical protein